MPPKASAGRRRTTAEKKQERIEIVVRRGAIRRFDALKTRTSELPVVVTWNRARTIAGTKATQTARRETRDRQSGAWKLALHVGPCRLRGR